MRREVCMMVEERGMKSCFPQIVGLKSGEGFVGRGWGCCSLPLRGLRVIGRLSLWILHVPGISGKVGQKSTLSSA